MFYIFMFLLLGFLLSVALFYYFRGQEQEAQIKYLKDTLAERDPAKSEEVEKLRARVKSLERFEGIPDIIERARRSREEVDSRIAQAQRTAENIIQNAQVEANTLNERIIAKLAKTNKQADDILSQANSQAQAQIRRLTREGEENASRSREVVREAEAQAAIIIQEAKKEARKINTDANKTAKEKKQQAEEVWDRAILDAQAIRRRAEERAKVIDGKAYEARGKLEHYESALRAIENIISGYGDSYQAPASHTLDELAGRYGFSKAGEELKKARQRTESMEKNGTAAFINYPLDKHEDDWKRKHAQKFLLNTFNGKVDTILARAKPNGYAKQVQMIKDAFELVNKDGEAYRNSHIQVEYLDARLEELRWAVAVQKIKETNREEQRAIREQIKEEERVRKERERAIQEAQKQEKSIAEALEKARKQFEQAGEANKAEFESKLADLQAKLAEAEEKGRKAISMAQQTKKGYVYIISNIGSFGENVYKIGLSRRLDPTERVKELGDASVPFPFDVHAMISAEDAPALEALLHRRFVEKQVNKINKRKEFFRVSLQEIKQVAEEMNLDANWTIEAEATQYKETQLLEQTMKTNADFKKKWIEDQFTFDFADAAYDEEEELEGVEA